MTEDIAALRRRLEQAEAMVDALQGGQVDAVVGKSGVSMLRLREVEKALEASERFAEQVVDASLTAIYIHDLDKGINVFINPAYTRLTGYTLDDLNRMNGETFFNLFHPEDRPAVTAHMDALRRAENGENREAIYRFRTKDDRWIWRHSRAAVFSRREDGAVREIIGNFQDITDWKQAERALKESEARFRDMSNGLPLMVWLHEAQGRLTFVNNSYREFFGVEEETMRGQKWKDLVHPEDRRTYIDVFLSCVKERRLFHAQARVRDGRGRWRWIESWGRPRFSASDEFLGFVGASADITERKQIEAELETAVRRKDEFLAMLGHELRNPLAAISAALRAGQKERDGKRGVWADEIVERQVDLLRRLVEDLLDVSRITRGKITLKKAPLDIGQHLRAAVQTLEQIDPAGSARVTISEPPTPLFVSADPLRLGQILSNLLGNAVKYSPEGGDIRLSVEKQDQTVLVRCRDRGIGIPPEQIPSVFETFTQLDTDLDRTGSGLGMGLALVKSLAEMHGGAVSAVSEGRGKGSEFRLTLPAIDPPIPEKAPNETRLPDEKPTIPARRRILIAEDNADLARSLQSVLERAGHIVRVAHSGRDAVAAAREETPDIALIDVGLPGLSGYGVAEAIRKTPGLGKTLLLGLSGYVRDPKQVVDYFDHYLMKPIDPGRLLRRIQGLIPSGPSPDQAADRVSDQASGPMPADRPLRVLLIEDHPALGAMMVMELKSHGYEPALAKTGEAGIRQAGDFRPDIVLCDLRLPGMNGVAVVRKLREMDAARSAFIVALSADQVADKSDILTSAGFDSAVTKPLDPKTLDRMVAERRRLPKFNAKIGGQR